MQTQWQTLQQRIEPLTEAGVPEEIAMRVASLGIVFLALEIHRVADKTGGDLERVTKVYFQLSEALSIDWLRGRIASMEPVDRWEETARTALHEDLESLQGELTQSVVECPQEGEDCVHNWLDDRERGLKHYKAVLEELEGCERLDVAKASVVVRSLRNLQLR